MGTCFNAGFIHFFLVLVVITMAKLIPALLLSIQKLGSAMALRGVSSPKDPKSDKVLVGIAIAAFCTLALAFGSVGIISRATEPTSASVETPVVAPIHPPSIVVASMSAPFATASALPAPPAPDSKSATSSSTGVPAIHNAPVNLRDVSASDLNKLADGVKLDDGALQRIDKAQWSAQLVVAKTLAQRPCDCEQRNWLNRFIETANDAATGSKDYFASVQLLDQLARNDTEQLTGTVSN